jgi:hypothetical protein
MDEAGFFSLWRSRTFGGSELSYTDFARVIEELSRSDGSVLCTMVAAVFSRLSGYLDENVGREIFGDGRAILAGSINSSGKATVVSGRVPPLRPLLELRQLHPTQQLGCRQLDRARGRQSAPRCQWNAGYPFHDRPDPRSRDHRLGTSRASRVPAATTLRFVIYSFPTIMRLLLLRGSRCSPRRYTPRP